MKTIQSRYMGEPDQNRAVPCVSIDGPEFEPAPEEWLQRALTPSPDIAWPIPKVDVFGRQNGPVAWAGYLALRFFQATLGRMPRMCRSTLGNVLARTVGALDRRHSRAALDFIQTALPDLALREQKAMVRESWKHLLELSLRAPYSSRKILHQPLGEHFKVRATPEARKLAEEGTSVIFVGAHVGYWELAGVALATLGFEPVYAVAKPPSNGPLSRFLQRSREKQGGRMLPRKEAMKSVPKVLGGGGSVMFMLDHRARSKPVFAPLFGRPAACERSGSVLLRRLKVPLLFYACYESEDKKSYELHLGPVWQPKDLEGLGPAEMAARINRQYETMILHRPKQYFWLHDRFLETPREWGDLEAELERRKTLKSQEPGQDGTGTH